MIKKLTVRVYGLLISDGRVLVSDEFIAGQRITKFPGGGLEFGEGPADCVVRELQEELNIHVEVDEHYYTTDFFVRSAFDPAVQVISIYYLVKKTGTGKISVSGKAHDYMDSEGAQSFRWLEINKMQENDLSLVIDQKVAGMLKRRFS